MKNSISKILVAVLCISLLVSANQVSVKATGEESAECGTVIETVEEATVEATVEATSEPINGTTNEAMSDSTDSTETESAAENSAEIEKLSFTERIAAKFANSLGKYVPDWVIVLLVSMMPILELRAGLFVAKFLNFDIRVAIPICVIGNIIPIPFILLFIKKIFKWLGKTKLFHKLIEKLEARAMKKSSALSKGEFWGLVLFVGIPIPGTGAWMGSLIAALLEIDIKKAIAAELVGIVIATIIVSILSYGLLGIFI